MEIESVLKLIIKCQNISNKHTKLTLSSYQFWPPMTSHVLTSYL